MVLHHQQPACGRFQSKSLWAYGLVQFIQKAIPVCVNTQTCIEVHAVISQYIIDSMNSAQVTSMTPFADSSIYQSVDKGLVESFQQSYGIRDVTKLTAVEYLKFTQSEIEHVQLPTSLKMVNMHTMLDPHIVIIDVATSSNPAHEFTRYIGITCRNNYQFEHSL